MLCKFCGVDPELVVLVPNRQKKQDGMLETFACLDCAKKEGLYCEKHDRPHIGFLRDDSTACLFCVEEEVWKEADNAGSVFYQLLKALPKDEWTAVSDAAQVAAEITGDKHSMAVLRFVVTKAHRLRVPLDKMVEMVCEQKLSSLILY